MKPPPKAPVKVTAREQKLTAAQQQRVEIVANIASRLVRAGHGDELSQADIRALTRALAPHAIETLAVLMVSAKNEKVRETSANSILDRAYGKAPTNTMSDPTTLDDSELERVAEEIMRRRAVEARQGVRSESVQSGPSEPSGDSEAQD